jgi:hypothetical protein
VELADGAHDAPVETLGVCELVAGLTLAWPKLVVPEEVWVEDGVDVVVVVAEADAVAGWPERARPTAAPKASTEPNTTPRFASAARRRAMFIGMAGIDSYRTTRA